VGVTNRKTGIKKKEKLGSEWVDKNEKGEKKTRHCVGQPNIRKLPASQRSTLCKLKGNEVTGLTAKKNLGNQLNSNSVGHGITPQGAPKCAWWNTRRKKRKAVWIRGGPATKGGGGGGELVKAGGPKKNESSDAVGAFMK